MAQMVDAVEMVVDTVVVGEVEDGETLILQTRVQEGMEEMVLL